MRTTTTPAAARRRDFISQRTGASLEHTGQYSFDPGLLPGNIEEFQRYRPDAAALRRPPAGQWRACPGQLVRADGDYCYSVTLPSLIVASYGGGTGLPTQRECLEGMACYGAGKARKLAEIITATVLCGEISLSAAVVAEEWVSNYDTYGRNRP
jgi:hydroxymethylglutaryl-CoA reductase